MTSKRAGLLGAASLLIFALPAFAQDKTYILDEIVISGELQDKTLQDSQTSVAVETGEQLETRGDEDLYDIVERTPNVTALYGQKGLAIRGVSQNGQGGSANGMLITTQVDGVALPSPQSTFFAPYSTWDLGQIEILRGPQSTQQGRNALAGAVVIRTNDPSFEEEYKLRAELASRNGQRFAVMANRPLSDTLAFRFTAETSDSDGWVTSRTLNDDRYDAKSYEAYRAKLRWAPNDRFDAVLSFSYTDSSGGEDYVLASEFPGARVTDQNAAAEEGSIHRAWGLKARYDINPTMTLESEASWYTQDYRRVEGSIAPRPVSLLTAVGRSEVFEQDIRLSFEQGIAKGVVGLFYTDIKDGRPNTLEVDLSTLHPALPALVETRENRFDTKTKNAAIYGEVDLDASALLSGLGFTIGARYDWEKFEFEQETQYALDALAGFGLVDIPPSPGDHKFTAFIPKFGVTYDFGLDQTVGFTVQRGYRSGGEMNNLARSTLHEYDPEFTTNYELSYRGAFYDNRLRVQGNLFYTKWKDQQVSVAGATTGSPFLDQFNNYTANAGESEMYGLELSVEGEPTDQLSLFANLGLNHTEIKKAADPALVGNSFDFAPEATFALGASYAFNNGLTVSADASYTGSSYQDVENTAKVDARWLLNTHATYDWGNGLVAGVYIRNLLDHDYTTSNYLADGLVRTGEPRTVGAYLTKTF